MVSVQFEVVLYYWMGLVWKSVCKKGKMFGIQRKCCQNFVKTHVFVLAIN